RDSHRSAVEITNYSATEISDVASLSTTAQDILQPVQEIPFTELGLGGYTPVGLLQSCFEFLHMSAGLPWWATIITATVIARCVMFPIIVKNQRASIRLSNVMPTFQKLTKKMNEARQSGNQFETSEEDPARIESSGPLTFTQDIYEKLMRDDHSCVS
ncbi:putative mitochondrial inner membrane protein OXA1L, partial [Apostichopus japonicus]